MNEIDINTLKEFAALTLNFLAEANEFEVTQMWQHIENERKLRKRLNHLYPIIESILYAK